MRADLPTARLIAQMLYPERPVERLVPPTEESLPRLLEGCARNKVPLLSLRPIRPALGCIYASDPYRRMYAEEEADWAHTRQEYLLVQQEWEQAGITAVLIKSAGLRPSLPYRSDNLDVLISPQHDRQARQILVDMGYIEVANVEEPLKFLFRKFHRGVSVSAIHLHEAIGWGTGFMDDPAVLHRARPAPDDPRILIPAPEDGLLVNMAHAFYEDKEIKLGDLWKVMHPLRSSVLDWDLVAGQACGRGWQQGLDTCIVLWSRLEHLLYGEHSFPPEIVQQAEARAPAFSHRYLLHRFEREISFPLRISFGFSKRHYYGKVLRDAQLSIRDKAIDVTRHSLAGIKRRLPFKTQPSMLVALSGIDGSGKTVHAEALCNAFQTCEISARLTWMRGGSSRLADRAIALFKPWVVRSQVTGRHRADRDATTASLEAEGALDMVSDTRQAKVQRKAAWLKRPLLRSGWTALVAVDLLLACWSRVWWPLVRGRVVISDRYIHDAIVELATLADSRQILQSWMAALLRLLCPKPDQAFLLDVSPGVALQRKPDESLPFMEQQALLYEQMAGLWSLRLVDTNDDEGKSVDLVVHETLRAYYRDWHTLVAGLFWANPRRH